MGLPNQFKRGFALALGQLEEVANMTEGDNQEMPFADGISIIAGVAKGIPKDDFLGNRTAKWALDSHNGEVHVVGESIWINSAMTCKSASPSGENSRIGYFSRSGLSGIKRMDSRRHPSRPID